MGSLSPPTNSQGPSQGPQGCIKTGRDVLSAGHPVALLAFVLGVAAQQHLGTLGAGRATQPLQCAGWGPGAAARPCAHELVPCNGRSSLEMGSSVMACGSLLLATARSATICKRQSARGPAR